MSDETGLKGLYSFKLEWALDSDEDRLSQDLAISRALEEQLGLRLLSLKGPTEVIVVDRIEMPSAN